MTNYEHLELCKALPKHSADCAKIYERAWNTALPDYRRTISEEEFLAETGGETTIVALQDAEVMGYISIWEPDCFIHHIYVDPNHQGVGIGTVLLNEAIMLAIARPLSLKCQRANTKAMEFYQHARFQETEEFGVDSYGPWVKLMRSATK